MLWFLRLFLAVSVLAICLIEIFNPTVELKLDRACLMPASMQSAWTSLQRASFNGIIRFEKGISVLELETSPMNYAAAIASQPFNNRTSTILKKCDHRQVGKILYFSSTDSTNPFSNSRCYFLKGEIALTNRGQVAISIFLFFILLLERWIANNNKALCSALAWGDTQLRPKWTMDELLQVKKLSKKVSNHIPELDGVRGYACISVLLAHCFVGILQPTNVVSSTLKASFNTILLAGVDLFFVLSGFLIAGSLVDSMKDSFHYFRNFWIRRCARILPVLCILLSSYGVALFFQATYRTPQLDLWLLAPPLTPIWNLLTFTQSIPMAEGTFTGGKWVGITWSLAIEEQFYLIFPILVYFLSRRALGIIALTGIVLAPFFRVYFAHLFDNWYASYVLLPSRMDAIMFGVLLALAVRNTHFLLLASKCRVFSDLASIFLFTSLVTDGQIIHLWEDPACGPFPPLKQSFIALLAVLLILRIVIRGNDALNRLCRNRFLMQLGAISYGLYMYHQSINGLLHGYVWNQEPQIKDITHVFGALIVISIAILVAKLSHTYLESPIRAAALRICVARRT